MSVGLHGDQTAPGAASGAIADSQRRRKLDDLVLQLKLAASDHKPAVLQALAELPGLIPAERRQVLLAARRYLFTAKSGLGGHQDLVLGAVLKLTTRDTWLLGLGLFRL